MPRVTLQLGLLNQNPVFLCWHNPLILCVSVYVSVHVCDAVRVCVWLCVCGVFMMQHVDVHGV